MERQTIITLLLSVFIALLGIGIIVPVIPIFAVELGASRFALGMVIAVFSVSVPHVASVDQLIGMRFFHGIGSAMIVPVAMAYMSFLAPEGAEGRYQGYLNIVVFCGIGCGPVVGGLLSDTLGMRAMFYAMAFFSFVAALLVVYSMPVYAAAQNPEQDGLFKSFAKMLRSRRTIGILLARYGTMVMMVPSMALLPLLMSGWDGVTGLDIGLVIAVRTFANAVFQVPFARLVDKGYKLQFLLLGTSVMCLALCLIPLPESVVAMILVYILLGCGEAAIWPVLGAYASEEGRRFYGHGTMMGVISLAMSAGVFTGAALTGVIPESAGKGIVFYCCALAVLGITFFAASLIYRAEKNLQFENVG